MKWSILLFLLFSSQVLAQERDTDSSENKTESKGCNSRLDLICKSQVRNSVFLFDKREKGAEFSIVNTEDKDNTYTVNGAWKYFLFSRPFKSTDFFFVSEWRRNTETDKEQNTWFFAISAQSLTGDIIPDSDECDIRPSSSPPCDESEKIKLDFVVDYYTNVGVKRDVLADRVSGFADISVAPAFIPSIENLWFSKLTGLKYDIPFELDPSIGFQYEGNFLAVDSLGSGGVLRFSPGINFTISPIKPIVKALGFKDLKLQASYYCWYDLMEAKDDRIDERDWFKKSATLVYDKNISFSIEYVQGSNPLEGYQKQNQIKFAIKAKLN